MNDLGQVVGSLFSTDGKVSGFLWTGAAGLRVLPAPGGFASARTFIYPLGINTAGQVVGFYTR
jgi:hypothetical protein